MSSDFSYHVRDDDLTREAVLKEQLLWGYDDILPTEFSSKYTEFVNSLIDIPQITESLEMKYLPTDENKIRQLQKTWKKLGISLSVIRLINANAKVNPNNLESINISELLQEVSFQNPFDMPIYLHSDVNNTVGALISYCMINQSHTNITPLIQGCNIPMVGNNHASCIFAHEIMHSQLITNGQGTKDYYNTELLPILIELIIAMTKSYKEYQKIYNYRLAQLAFFFDQIYAYKSMDYIDRIEFEKYINSSIKGLYLSKIFFNGNDHIKSDMIEMINNILCGKSSIENLLLQYNLSQVRIENNLSSLSRIR